MIDLSPTAQLERLRARCNRLAQVGGFEPPAPDADMGALMRYRAEHHEALAEADILDEIMRIQAGELFAPEKREARPTDLPKHVNPGEPRRPCLAEEAEEMLERRRAFLSEWSREFGFEQPPQSGGWDELATYEARNAAAIERADLQSEVNRVLCGDA